MLVVSPVEPAVKVRENDTWDRITVIWSTSSPTVSRSWSTSASSSTIRRMPSSETPSRDNDWIRRSSRTSSVEYRRRSEERRVGKEGGCGGAAEAAGGAGDSAAAGHSERW